MKKFLLLALLLGAYQESFAKGHSVSDSEDSYGSLSTSDSDSEENGDKETRRVFHEKADSYLKRYENALEKLDNLADNLIVKKSRLRTDEKRDEADAKIGYIKDLKNMEKSYIRDIQNLRGDTVSIDQKGNYDFTQYDANLDYLDNEIATLKSYDRAMLRD